MHVAHIFSSSSNSLPPRFARKTFGNDAAASEKKREEEGGEIKNI